MSSILKSAFFYGVYAGFGLMLSSSQAFSATSVSGVVQQTTVTGSCSSASCSPTISLTVPSGSNQLLMVVTGVPSFNSISRVTFDGNSLTALAAGSGANSSTQVWYMVNPPITTANVVVTVAGSFTSGAAVTASVFSGVNTSSPFGTVADITTSWNGSSDSSSSTVSSASGGLVFGAVTSESAPITATESQTIIGAATGSSFDITTKAATLPGASSVTLGWSAPIAVEMITVPINSGSISSPTLGLQTAASADRFVDSIGVNTHLSYVGSAYWNYLTNPSPDGYTTISSLKTLGVRHIRDSIETTSSSFGLVTCGPMQTISANGASWDLYTNYQYTGDTVATTVTADLATAFSCLGSKASYLLAFEGPNELDDAPCADQYCTAEVLQQAAMTKAAQEASVFPSTTNIFAAAPANGRCEADTAWGAADGGQLATNIKFTNNHGYFGNDQPDIAATGGSVCGLGPLYGSWKYFMAAAGLLAPSSHYPVVTTETGYTDGCCGITGEATPVDPTTKTKYEMRDLLGYFVNGSYYTFIYDLATDSTGTFGLTDQYLNPKPAYIAIENLIKILSDPGSSYSPPGLELKETFPSDVSSLLLGKRDGSYWLVLWQNNQSYNTVTDTAIVVTPTTGTLTFSTAPTVINQYVFNPVTGTVTVDPVTPGTSVTVPISDTPEVIQIGPSSAVTLAN
jgi:hypothetical protein